MMEPTDNTPLTPITIVRTLDNCYPNSRAVCMIQTIVYDETKFSIVPSRNGVTVYYDDEFWENADSYKEAEDDIRDVL